ncbi:hypothetical protein BKA60DRAFT_10270 [Fusarium oxysporum]|nr:hypothetical protein BKA60DRAFT_10270 [Fusarium oxysporum]
MIKLSDRRTARRLHRKAFIRGSMLLCLFERASSRPVPQKAMHLPTAIAKLEKYLQHVVQGDLRVPSVFVNV